jgi:hypothetical protein
MANTGAFRESMVKPLVYFGMAALVIFLLVFVLISNLVKNNIIAKKQQNLISWATVLIVLGAGIFSWFAGDLGSYMFPTRTFLNANHFLLSVAVLFVGIWFYLRFAFTPERKLKINGLSVLISILIVSGILMLLNVGIVTSLAYTIFDLSLVGILAVCIYYAEKLFMLKIENED